MFLDKSVCLGLLLVLLGCASGGSAPDGLRPAEIADREALAAPMHELYPDDLRTAGIGGRVVVGFVVESDGTTSEIEIVTSSGHERLDRASLEVVRRMRWHPATWNGVPEDQPARLPIQWTPRALGAAALGVTFLRAARTGVDPYWKAPAEDATDRDRSTGG